jgi:exosortase/archaeosortase family protein
MSTHGRDLRFLIIFGLLMLGYYFLTTTYVVDQRFVPWYLKATTQAAGGTLHAVGYDAVSVEGNDLVGKKGRITVERGCDAIAPTALFVSAVIASPAAIGSKAVAVLAGVSILMLVNLVRIITLFLTAVHWPAAFDVMHLDVWQAAFIFLAIVLWALWASWAARRRARAQRVTA